MEVNCAAIPSELIESELFGHEKGSFTSAVKQRIGKFEQADGGTLFLDEIGDMSLSAQAKVLRALQENKITRVGGEKEISVNVRVLAATNKDLLQEIADKNFREDLYHHLSVILIQVPSLNERRDDVPLLIEKFLKDIAQDYGNKPKKIDDNALSYLQALDWRGNIRELRNVVERLVIMSDDTISGSRRQSLCGQVGPGWPLRAAQCPACRPGCSAALATAAEQPGLLLAARKASRSVFLFLLPYRFYADILE